MRVGCARNVDGGRAIDRRLLMNNAGAHRGGGQNNCRSWPGKIEIPGRQFAHATGLSRGQGNPTIAEMDLLAELQERVFAVTLQWGRFCSDKGMEENIERRTSNGYAIWLWPKICS